MNRTLPAVFALLTLVLTACPAAEPPGSTPTPEPGPAPEPTVTAVGFVDFHADLGVSPFQEAVASFFAVPETPVSRYGYPRKDECSVTGRTEAARLLPEEPPGGTFIDAGVEVRATAGGQTYAVLTKRFDNSLTYRTDMFESLSPLPETAFTLTVPGATFPAITTEAPGIGADLELLSPENLTTIGPTSTFEWEPFQVAGSDVHVILYAGQEIGRGYYSDVFCRVIDDGLFSFPAETQAQMRAVNISAGALTLTGRVVSRTHLQGNAALVLRTTWDRFDRSLSEGQQARVRQRYMGERNRFLRR